MRDDQKRALLADGGKGEAVAWMHDGDNRPDCISNDVKNVLLASTPKIAEHYTIPLYTAPQAECAPRGAQPVTEILRLLSKMHDECGTNAGQDALWDAHEAVEQLLAAPTPERAQESAGVRLSASQLGELYHTARNADSFRSFQKVADEILAANKEPQP
jgi:hypothetical protein